MSTSHTHAKDYLLEFLSSKGDKIPDWIHKLIHKVIENDGILSKEEKDSMFIDFIKSRGVDIPDILDPTEKGTPIDYTESYAPREKRNILLQKLTHVKGVNALIENESITFSPNCTILFGMNGSGKSGYFKVLNELAGGGYKQEILSNIYNPGDGGKGVIIEYSKDGVSESPITWKGDIDRGIFPEITVFDSKYLEKYIGARKSGIDPQPLGLHYFSVITKTIEDYGSFLEDSITTLHKPDLSGIATLIQSQELKGLLEIQIKPSTSDYEKIDALKEFGEEMIEQLKQKEIVLDKIKSSDIHIKLNQTRIKALGDFIKSISQYELLFRVKYWKLHFAIKQFKDAKERQKIMQESLSILKNIPHEGMGSWEEFIKSADKYKKECAKNHQDIREEVCPYCHQEIITPDSKLLLQTYTKYLEDTSTKEVQNRGIFLKGVIEEIQKIQIIGLDVIPEPEKLIDENSNYSSTFNDLDNHFTSIKKDILSNYNAGKEIAITRLTSFRNITLFLETILSNIQKEQDDFIKSVAKKEEVQKEFNQLNDKKIISMNYSTIRSYYDFLLKKHKLEDVKKETSSHMRSQISTISTTASENLGTLLVNETLKTELYELHEGLSVSLVKVSNTGGVVELKPQISGWDAARILSEGELKALGLAILLTNIIHQDSPCIVLDDPVNSMDHDLSNAFASRIIELTAKTDKQIVVFTHNLLFASQLVSAIDNFNIKDTCNFHTVSKETTKSGIILKDYYPKMQNEGVLIEKFDKSFSDFDNKNPEEQERVLLSSGSLLRSAIECVIEDTLLGGVVRRYDTRVNVNNLEQVIFNSEIIKEIIKLHGDISKWGQMHNSPDILIGGINQKNKLLELRKKYGELKEKINPLRKTIISEREKTQKESKKDPFSQI